MPGRRITNQQVKIYMTSRLKGCTQEVSAARSGMSVRTGRDLEKGKRPIPAKPSERHWRTRKDPLVDVWASELAPMLEAAPGLSPITLLEYLQDRYGDKYPDSVLRTLERRVKEWRAFYGPDKESKPLKIPSKTARIFCVSSACINKWRYICQITNL